MTEPALEQFISPHRLQAILVAARLEDLGPDLRDVSTQIMVPADQRGIAMFHARGAGRLSGAALLPHVAALYDPAVTVALQARDGQALEAGGLIAVIRGALASILAIERVALNLMTHMSGIATLTDRYVQAVAASKARIYDTRKTTPGLRELEKYAVVCGGGCSHRMGLHDAVLIKDNHIAHLPLERLGDALGAAVRRARTLQPPPEFFEVEVDTLAQLERVLPCGCDIVLLDNMSLADLRQAVALRDRMNPRVELEASGGVNLQTVAAIAATGVDRIAVGSITHSAPALDIGLDIEA